MNSTSLFFGVWTRLLIGVATMWVLGYCVSSSNASSGIRRWGNKNDPQSSTLVRLPGNLHLMKHGHNDQCLAALISVATERSFQPRLRSQ